MSFQHQVLCSIALVLLASQVSPAWAKKVKCDKGESLQEAIDEASEGDEIKVKGTCNESIVFDSTRHLITLTGKPGASIVSPDPSQAAISILGARNIIVTGLTLTGGVTGVGIVNGSARLSNNSISASGIGVWILNNARGVLQDNIISDAATGIDLLSSASAFISNTTLQNIGNIGLAARLGSAFRAFRLTVNGSTSRGVDVSENSSGTISRLNISLDSVGVGIEVRSGGSLEVNNATLNNATVFSADGLATLRGATLDGGGAIGPAIGLNGGSVHVDDSTVQAFEQAVFSVDGLVTLKRVTLDGGGSDAFGVETSGGSIRMQGVTVQGFNFGVVVADDGFVEINGSTVNGNPTRGLWVTGGSANVQGSTIVGSLDGVIVEGGRITVGGGSTIYSLGLNYASSAEVLDSELIGNPSLSPGFSSSVRVVNTTMEHVVGVRNCSLQFQDGTTVTGAI